MPNSTVPSSIVFFYVIAVPGLATCSSFNCIDVCMSAELRSFVLLGSDLMSVESLQHTARVRF